MLGFYPGQYVTQDNVCTGQDVCTEQEVCTGKYVAQDMINNRYLHESVNLNTKWPSPWKQAEQRYYDLQGVSYLSHVLPKSKLNGYYYCTHLFCYYQDTLSFPFLNQVYVNEDILATKELNFKLGH